MTDIVMWDSISDTAFPPGGAAYAAYVDGTLGGQPNYDFIVANFPSAEHLGIALNPADEAECLDVENGAAKASDVKDWHARQAARGITRPVVYASAWTMKAQVLPVLADADIPLASVRLWTAHYGDGPHLCGPNTCRLMPVDADATQWTCSAVINGAPRDLDESLLLPDFFGQLPADWTYSAPLGLSATGGHESVRLEWLPPQGFPEVPAAYRVWIYKGTRADLSTLVPSYPREAVDGALQWQGGALERGSVYTAHVAAMGVDGTRMRPYGFAAAIFITG